MKYLRSLLVGLIIGGAFGAKIGAYLALIGAIGSYSWPVIEVGFVVGSGFGIACALAVLFVRSGILERNQPKAKAPSFLTKTSMG